MNKRNKPGRHGGFTLVELAIVLVVVGLLLGGVMKGTDMIKKAKAERMVADIRALAATILDYQKQRGRMPGDCNGDGFISLNPWKYDETIGVSSVTDTFSAATTLGAICDKAADEADAGQPNLPWDELKSAGAFDMNRPNNQIARHAYDDYISIGSVTDATSKKTANAIFVHGVPLAVARTIDAAIDPVLSDNVSTAGKTGRVRLCVLGTPTSENCGGSAVVFPTATGGNADTKYTISYQFDVRTLP